MHRKIVICIALSFGVINVYATPHWNCLPNDDVIEYADCTSNTGVTLRVTDPSELGDTFTISGTFPSGSTFEGTANNGKYYGKRIDEDGTIYEGPLNGFYFEGIGKITSTDGSSYEGEILADQANGFGKLTWGSNPDFLVLYSEGIFKDGNFTNDTTHYYKNGWIVQGTMDENGHQGEVTIDFSSAPRKTNDNDKDSLEWVFYEGGITDNLLHGYGKLTYLSGEIYEGHFKEDKRHGYGELIFNLSDEELSSEEFDHSKISGIWKDDSLSGTGMKYDKFGNLYYFGELKEGLRHGLGTSFVYGTTWVGQHINDAVTGVGTMTFEDGSYYKGYVVEANFEGPGELYYVRPREHYVGNFIDNNLEGEGEYISDDFSYSGPFKDGLFHGTGKITLVDGETYFAEYSEGNYIGEQEFIPEKAFKRIALVIGNDNYDSGPLDNAVSDSLGMKLVLESSGFEVIHESDLDQSKFLAALSKFESLLKRYGSSTEALFYYAGHAVQVDGINYLNPIDAKIETKYDLDIRSINISRIFSIMDKTVSGVKIVILDACRNNPYNSFIRSPQLGLAQMNAPSGMIISYSTAPGSVALDGTVDGYGYFTGSLVNAINTPGLTIEEVFKRTRQSVVSMTNRQQIPWESSSLLGDFYFSKD